MFGRWPWTRRSGTLYAGTGPHGRIYKISPDGKARFSTRRSKITSSAWRPVPTASVYAGVDKSGLVYRIDAKGKAFVLYQAAQAEIRTLKATADALYVGTSAPTKRHGGGCGRRFRQRRRRRPSWQAASRRPRPSSAVKASEEKEEKSSKSERVRRRLQGKQGQPGRPLLRPRRAARTPSIGSALDGGVREVFREKAMMLCLARQGSISSSARAWTASFRRGRDDERAQRDRPPRPRTGPVHVPAPRRFHRSRRRRSRQALRP